MKEYEYTYRAMGTDIALSLITDEPAQLDTAFDTVRASIDAYEQTYSRFLSDSMLSQLNKKGSLQVNTEFIDILHQAIEQTKNTNGCFNPLLQVKQLGYTDDFEKIKDGSSTTQPVAYDTDIEKISIDGSTNTVTLAPNQQLDFGGCLKGYVAQKLATQLIDSGNYQGVIVNMGGDLATYGTDEHDRPFVFTIWNPVTHTDHEITLRDLCLATSGTYKRKWQSPRGPTHHIMDTTGSNTEQVGVVSASVTGPSGFIAETLTKVLINTPLKIAQAHLPLLYQYIIIKKDGTVESTII